MKKKMTGGGQGKSLEQSRNDRKYLQRMLLLKDAFSVVNMSRFLYNWSPAGFLYGPAQYSWTELPIDLAETIDLLCKVSILYMPLTPNPLFILFKDIHIYIYIYIYI